MSPMVVVDPTQLNKTTPVRSILVYGPPRREEQGSPKEDRYPSRYPKHNERFLHFILLDIQRQSIAGILLIPVIPPRSGSLTAHG
jgi:hypothetical protein